MILLSKVEFSYFYGQKLIDIDTEKMSFLRLIFNNSQLSVECPWRLRSKKEIFIGESDCISAPDKFSRLSLKKIIKDKKIVEITYYEHLFLLTIELENGLYFDLFHSSSYFEGWVLHGDNGVDIFTMPGGEISD